MSIGKYWRWDSKYLYGNDLVVNRNDKHSGLALAVPEDDGEARQIILGSNRPFGQLSEGKLYSKMEQ